MKVLGSLFRFLCAFVVLLAVAVYLDGSLKASLLEYISSFTLEHIRTYAVVDGWFAIAAGAVLLLALCCGMKLGWNLLYSLATVLFFAGTAVILLGPELALPSAARGLGWEPVLRELPLTYPVPVLMVPVLCILGCLCSTAPVRIAWTSLYSCVLCYGCAELLAYGVQQWEAMPEPFLPRALAMIHLFPWILFALPAVFFLQYCLFMALFETFMPRGKAKARKTAKKTAKQEEKSAEPPAEDAKPAPSTEPKAEVRKTSATVPVVAKTLPAKPVVLKRPVIHKKSPISADKSKEEDTPEEPQTPTSEAPAEEAPSAEVVTKAEEAPKADAPAETKPEEEKSATPAE